MLTVEINQIASTESGLAVGVVVRYGDNGPVRFVSALIRDDVLDWETMTDITRWLNRQTDRHMAREHELAYEMNPLPGMESITG